MMTGIGGSNLTMPIEHIGPSRWSLAGSVTTASDLVQTGHSLKFIRRFDGLSAQIRSAMNARSTLPVVEINTPEAVLTLASARILNILPHVPHTTPKHVTGALDTHEIEEVELTFSKITIIWKHGKKGLSDNWQTGH